MFRQPKTFYTLKLNGGRLALESNLLDAKFCKQGGIYMKVLVIIDMQYDFIDGALGTPEAQKIVPNVVDKIKSEDKDTVIIFTKDTHYADYLKTQEGERLPIPHCIRETDGWNIHKDVRAAWLAKEDRFVISQEVFDIEENNTIEK